MKNYIILGLFTGLSTFSIAQKISLNLSSIRSTQGHIQVSIYENEKQYKEEKPLKYLYFDKKNLKEGKMSIALTLKEGTYGITLLDDEDMSNGMTFKMGFYPKEGVGFSNYEFKGVSKPKFSDFKLEVKGDSNVNVPFRYF